MLQERYAFFLILSLCSLLISNGFQVDSYAHGSNFMDHVSVLENHQPYRTAYHFQPSKNWMNDPNGPMYYQGKYHLFYQYNPYGALWGNMSWGHAVSYDLINWLLLDVAFHPTKPYEINGCFSGSVTILPGNKPAILYTGVDLHNNQTQNLAVPKDPSDPFLREWVKSPHNPIITHPQGVQGKNFRDPTTAWMGPDGEWRVMVGGEFEFDHHGVAFLYKSKDFSKWTKCPNPLHSSNKTNMWECPDFYPVSLHGENGLDTSVQGKDVKHVLKASFNGHDYYVIGNYDAETDRYVVDTDFMDKEQFRYDYGRFYASKSFYDGAKKRRVLWSWIDEGDSESDDVKRGWSGLQSVPRSIWLSKSGKQLMQWPVKELDKLRLRKQKVTIDDKQLKPKSLLEISGITASQADVEVSFSLSNLNKAEVIDSNQLLDPQLLCAQNTASVHGSFGPFGLLLLASNDLKEQTAVYFRVFNGRNKFYLLMCTDLTRSSLRHEVNKASYGAFLDLDPRHEKVSLRSLIDHSIVESFGGEGRTCMTSRVYPVLAVDEQTHLYAFNNGTESITITSLTAWSMKKAQIVPMGKRRKPIT